MENLPHYPHHLIMGVVALAATLLISRVTVNRLVQRKLRLSRYLLAIYALLHVLIAVQGRMGMDMAAMMGPDLQSLESLIFAAAVINLIVIAAINPLREDRVPERMPAILQDAAVILGLVLLATFVFHDKLVMTSAVGAFVVGFALQDTLGNAFAGLALQSEKPFNVGHWIRVGEFEGRVSEVTWRATKLRTKTGNFIVLPNNLVAKEAITNYSEPVAPTRLQVEVGASYNAPPTEVRAAIKEALAQCAQVLDAPAPDALVQDFSSSSITYRVWFWIADYEQDERARDQVRTGIYYAFNRHGIEIPYPIQVEYGREWPEKDAGHEQREREKLLAGTDLLSGLSEAHLSTLASKTVTRVFGNGEAIVRQGEPGSSMFVICSGCAEVLLGPERRHVADIKAGGYFGEMSVLTGEPRSATVVARGDVMVIELDADLFRSLGASSPQAIEQVGMAAATRRAELDQLRAANKGAAVVDAPANFLSRMRRFLGLR